MGDISNKQVFSFIFKMLRPYPRVILLMCLVSLAWAIDLSLRPYLLKIILNRIAGNPREAVFVYLAAPVAVYISLAFVMTSLFRLWNYFVEIKMIPRLRQQIASSAVSKLLRHSHHYYQNNFSGSLANKVNDLTSSIPDILEITFEHFLGHSLALIIATFTLWQVNIKFALALLIWVTFFMVGAFIFSRKIVRFADLWSEQGSIITGSIVDVLSNILSVRLFARQKNEKSSLESTFEDAVRAEQKLQWTYFWIWFFYGNSYIIYLCFSFYFLMEGLQEGTLSAGDFALVLTLNLGISQFLWEMTRDFSQFSKYLGRITQALRTIMLPVEIEDVTDAKALVVHKGEIVFDQAGFYYKGAVPLFENLSVSIKPGQKVGLVGYSGSGKSTFVNLILRLYDVTGGRVLIDGQDIYHVTQGSLRQAIGMIPQDPSLFHRTLKENICYGQTEASDDAVVEAAKRAHAHDFITALPHGYASLVGERGVKLSGGQRQRIAIARAVLKNAPVLILDEATSQLDSVTESYIQESLWKLMQNKTTIVIAHRLSTLLHMDRILVFDQGKIVEDGTHQDLLANKGLYKTLWDAQVGGFLPEYKDIKIE